VKVLVTAANGFVGTNLCAHLIECGHDVHAAVRRSGSAPSGTHEVVVGNIDESTAWAEALAGQDAVVHLAARVHVMTDTAADPLEEFRKVNTRGALALARAAAADGVGKFVFLSSIKANGEGAAAPYSVRDIARPGDPYGISKFEAERGLADIARSSPMHVVSIRTPLVYGPDVGGNFGKILALVDRGVPLPLTAVANRRTMTSIWNLVDLIEYELRALGSGSDLVMAGDPTSMSTPQLIRSIASGFESRPRLFWFPLRLLELGARLLRRQGEASRLIGSLEVEVGSTASEFSWIAPVSTEDGIERTTRAWRASKRT